MPVVSPFLLLMDVFNSIFFSPLLLNDDDVEHSDISLKALALTTGGEKNVREVPQCLWIIHLISGGMTSFRGHSMEMSNTRSLQQRSTLAHIQIVRNHTLLQKPLSKCRRCGEARSPHPPPPPSVTTTSPSNQQ